RRLRRSRRAPPSRDGEARDITLRPAIRRASEQAAAAVAMLDRVVRRPFQIDELEIAESRHLMDRIRMGAFHLLRHRADVPLVAAVVLVAIERLTVVRLADAGDIALGAPVRHRKEAERKTAPQRPRTWRGPRRRARSSHL